MIQRFKTKPTLFQRVIRSDAVFACVLVLGLFFACAVAELLCTLAGAGAGLQP